MRVAVTGGAGFIGANLVRALMATPEVTSITVVDDLSTGARHNLAGLDVELHVGTILDGNLLARAFDGVDRVVHLAALPSVPRSLVDPVATHVANVDGTVAVLEASRWAGQVPTIVASSSSVYGANPTLPKHEDLPVAPVSPYAASKLAAESWALAYGRSFGLPVLAFRFFNVFGPLQPADHAYAAVIPTFVSRALRGEPLEVHGDGRQSRDFTFVGSVAAVIVDALVRRVTHPGPVNLAFGTRHTLLEVVAALEAVLGRPCPVLHTSPRPGDVRHSQADTSRLRSLVPDIAPVPFAHGLEETVAWHAATSQPALAS